MHTAPKKIWFAEGLLWVELQDARIVGAPLAWFPRLHNATPKQRERYELSPYGLHWEELDEDISIEGLLAGQGDLRSGGMRQAG